MAIKGKMGPKKTEMYDDRRFKRWWWSSCLFMPAGHQEARPRESRDGSPGMTDTLGYEFTCYTGHGKGINKMIN